MTNQLLPLSTIIFLSFLFFLNEMLQLELKELKNLMRFLNYGNYMFGYQMIAGVFIGTTNKSGHKNHFRFYLHVTFFLRILDVKCFWAKGLLLLVYIFPQF